MKKSLTLIVLTITFSMPMLKAGSQSDTLVYLITCAPGEEAYSIYGHSALRVVIQSSGYDMVYNWGVFDFSTPHFVWKFAKGRLNYMLGVYPWDLFIREYFRDKRTVWSQKVNLEDDETEKLMMLLQENLKPENIFYRYDFFYDNCSTRIRDLFENIFGKTLIYPPDERRNMPSFRGKITEYQKYYPWLKAGVDLLLGLPADKKASFHDRMFLPEELMSNLSQAVINRNRKMVPLLQTSQTLFEFEPAAEKPPFYISPMLIFSLLFTLILFLSVQFRESPLINYIDIFLFALFSVLSILLFFFSFITDHQQTRMNLNIVWLNPFILFCLASLVMNRKGIIWFRTVFWLSAFFFLVAIIFSSGINSAFIPVVLIIILRSGARAGFSWNPFGITGTAA